MAQSNAVLVSIKAQNIRTTTRFNIRIVVRWHEKTHPTNMRSLFFTIAPLLQSAWAAFYYPDPQTYLLEHILVDNWGAHASNFSSAITPCTNYVSETGDPALNSGRTTAAQWMRVLFHDFITADVHAGTGGVDASIGFETSRAENKGSAFNDSFTFWGGYVNDFVSSKRSYSQSRDDD